MPSRAKTAFTILQRAELGRLLAAGAVSPDTAKCVYDLGMKQANPNVIGILIEKGLVLKRVIQVSFSSRTHYWLTEDGLATAKELGF